MKSPTQYNHLVASLDAEIGATKPETIHAWEPMDEDPAPWSEGLGEAASSDVAQGKGVGNHKPQKPPIDPLAALSSFAVNEEMVREMEATKIIWRGAIPDKHIIVINAPGNGGKTTIAKFAAGELAQAGHTVMFFQEDAGAGDIPALHEHAEKFRYLLLNSTLSQSTPDQQLGVLQRFVKEGSNLDGFVLFFDTLKKYTDLMSKGGARAFFTLMRGLTQRGATIVLLGHTNKHVGLDGKLIFEGVADVRNDVDELFYIESTKPDANNRVLLTMTPDKQRAPVKPVTFELAIDTMELRVLDRAINVRELQRVEVQREEDAPINQAILNAIGASGMNRTELVELVAKATGFGVKAVRRVLDRHCTSDASCTTSLWLETYIRLKNTRYIARHPNVPPLPNCRTAKPAELAELSELPGGTEK
jgi:hypothetical protein